MRLDVAMLVCALWGCGVIGPEEVLEPCVEEASMCAACQSDADCVMKGNTCEERAYCTHRDMTITTTGLGCNGGYQMPPDSACACDGGVCRYQP